MLNRKVPMRGLGVVVGRGVIVPAYDRLRAGIIESGFNQKGEAQIPNRESGSGNEVNPRRLPSGSRK